MRKLVELLGLAGVLAIGIGLFSLVFAWSALLPLQAELAARQAVPAPAVATVSTASQNVDELSQLYARFPPLGSLTGQVEGVHRLARVAGLQLQRVEYRLEKPDSGLVAYRVSMPVRGEYGALRHFMSAVLKEIPVASIDRLRFERKKPADTQLDAQIELTLFFRPPQAAEIP